MGVLREADKVVDKASDLENMVGTGGALHEVATTGAGGAGGVMGGIGLGLSGYGLAKSIHSIATDGANGENVPDTLFNGAGLAAGITGFAGGAATAVASPLLTMFAAGGALGGAGNNHARKNGLAGKNDFGNNRNWSEMAADWGRSAKELGGDGLIGDALGIAGTYYGSLAGVAGTLVNAPDMAIDAIGDLITGPTALQSGMDFVTRTKAEEKAKKAKQDAYPTVHEMVDWTRGGARGVPVAQPGKK